MTLLEELQVQNRLRQQMETARLKDDADFIYACARIAVLTVAPGVNSIEFDIDRCDYPALPDVMFCRESRSTAALRSIGGQLTRRLTAEGMTVTTESAFVATIEWPKLD